MTVNPRNVRQEFLPDEALKIEVEADTAVKNLVPNPSGEGGAWGWATPLANTTLEQVFADSTRYKQTAAVVRNPPPSWPTGSIGIRVAGNYNKAYTIGISNNSHIPDGEYSVITQQNVNMGGVVGWVTEYFIADFEPVASTTVIDNAMVKLPNELQFQTTTSQVAYTDTSWFKVTAGQYLQARTSITAITSTTSIGLQLFYRDANGNGVGSGNSSNVRSTSGTVFFGAYQVPAGAVEAKLRIVMYGSTASGTTTPAAANAYVCFNQVQVIQTASSSTPQTRKNLAANPNFEANLDGVSAGTTGNTITRATDQKWQGTYSAKFTVSAYARAWARFFYYSNGTVATDITTNTAHNLSFYIRTSLHSREVTVSLRLGTSATSTSGDYDIRKVVTVPTANTWTRIDVPFNSGSKTKFKYMSVIASDISENTTTYWFDGFLLEAGSSTVGSYFDGSTIPATGWTSSWDGATNASRSTATSPAAQFDYVPPVVYQEITGSIVSCGIQRAGLEVDTMQLYMTDTSLDPATSDALRQGRRIRVFAKLNGVLYSRFTGKINTARSDYEPRPNKPMLTNINVTAVGAAADLANTKRANSVVDVAELPSLLEGQNVPWNINGENGQTLINPVTAGVNENASLLDQIALVRDTPRYGTGEGPSYAFVSRDGVLTVRSENTQAARASTVLTENDGDLFYNSEFKLAFDSDSLINEVLIKAQRLTGSGETQQTEEWSYGPFRDQDSINKWGSHSKEFTVATSPSATITSTYWNAFVADIFDRNSEPTMLMSSVQVPILNDAGLAFIGTLDLYDKLNITNAEKGYDEVQNIVGITETITADRWIVDIQLAGETSVASPETQPDIAAAPVEFKTVGARIYQGTSMTCAVNAETQIWQLSQTQHNDNIQVSGTQGLTIPVDGWYIIAGQVQIPAPGDLDRAGVTLHVVAAGTPSNTLNNQIASNILPFPVGDGSTHFWVASTPYYCTAGQIVRMGFYIGPNSTAGSRSTSGNGNTWLSAVKVGG